MKEGGKGRTKDRSKKRGQRSQSHWGCRGKEGMKVSPHMYVLLPPAIYCPPPFQQKNGAERRREREIETERVSKIWLSISRVTPTQNVCYVSVVYGPKQKWVRKEREKEGERFWLDVEVEGRLFFFFLNNREAFWFSLWQNVLLFFCSSWITSSFCEEVLFPLSSWKRLTSSNVSASSSYSFSLCGDYGFCHLLHFISMICFIVSDI